MAEDWKRRSLLKSWAISRTYSHVLTNARVYLYCAYGDIAYQALEGELADKKFRRLLVSTNLAQCDGTGLVAVRLLDATGGRCALAGY